MRNSKSIFCSLVICCMLALACGESRTEENTESMQVEQENNATELKAEVMVFENEIRSAGERIKENIPDSAKKSLLNELISRADALEAKVNRLYAEGKIDSVAASENRELIEQMDYYLIQFESRFSPDKAAADMDSLTGRMEKEYGTDIKPAK